MPPAYESLEQEGTQEISPLKQKLAVFFSSWYANFVIFCGLLLAILLLMWLMFPHPTDSNADKVGAGLLLVQGDQILLLLRNSKHNDRTWGLPGGNADPHDASLLATATREATEEMGSLPEYEVLTEILTKRGKRQQKHYTVYVCNVTSPHLSEYQPQLNQEHRSYKWFTVDEAASLANLHPVVAALLRDPLRKSLSLALAARLTAGLSGGPIKKLGAGLFLMATSREVLLLTRNSSHNNATLSVPGGNVDLDDEHLLETATREAYEEMGAAPAFQVRGEIDTRRGKHGEKLFKIFCGSVSDETRANFRPVLSSESLAWGWYPLQELPGRTDMHPVVEILVRDHMAAIEAAFGISPSPQG